MSFQLRINKIISSGAPSWIHIKFNHFSTANQSNKARQGFQAGRIWNSINVQLRINLRLRNTYVLIFFVVLLVWSMQTHTYSKILFFCLFWDPKRTSTCPPALQVRQGPKTKTNKETLRICIIYMLTQGSQTNIIICVLLHVRLIDSQFKVAQIWQTDRQTDRQTDSLS